MAVTVREVAPPPPPKPPAEPPHEDRRPEGPPPPRVATRVGIWLFVGAVTLFFLALTSALLARAEGLDWVRIPFPRILWGSTAAILSSSFALEQARRALGKGDGKRFRGRLQLAALLGGGFLAAQFTAWRELSHHGLSLANSPHTAYFYLLTGAHAAHLLGGLAWFGALVRRARRGQVDPERIADFAVYWHFLAGLWVYLFAVLFL